MKRFYATQQKPEKPDFPGADDTLYLTDSEDCNYWTEQKREAVFFHSKADALSLSKMYLPESGPGIEVHEATEEEVIETATDYARMLYVHYSGRKLLHVRAVRNRFEFFITQAVRIVDAVIKENTTPPPKSRMFKNSAPPTAANAQSYFYIRLKMQEGKKTVKVFFTKLPRLGYDITKTREDAACYKTRRGAEKFIEDRLPDGSKGEAFIEEYCPNLLADVFSVPAGG